MNLDLLLPTLVGAVASLPYLGLARAAGRREDRLYALGLIVAAVIYLGFAAIGGGGRELLFEGLGVAVFTALALAGLRLSPYLLAAGWAGHVAWDLYFHPTDASGYAPWWYPAACVGFDLFVAGFIAGRVAARGDSL